ncbi:MAG: hypothetical protein FJ150_09195 [Euryarchaeota archaeon]|nr:hypothetical protein [Euryarchaeota archaeon]
MAVLTAAGITFGNNTVLNSKYGIFPQNVPVVFYQAAAPLGWNTPATQYGNHALRVVASAAGGGSGGNIDFTSALSSKPISANVPVSISGLGIGGFTINTSTMGQHNHPANNGGGQSNSSPSPTQGNVTKVANGSNTGNTGNSGGHDHPVSFPGGNGPLNTSMDFNVSYVSVIYCTFG